MPRQQIFYELVEIDHVDGIEFVWRADEFQVRCNIGGKITRVCGEQHFLTATASQQSCSETFRAMHGHHGLSRTGTAEQAERTMVIMFHIKTLRWMQEHTPLFQRRIQNTFEIRFSLHDHERLLRCIA